MADDEVERLRAQAADERLSALRRDLAEILEDLDAATTVEESAFAESQLEGVDREIAAELDRRGCHSMEQRKSSRAVDSSSLGRQGRLL